MINNIDPNGIIKIKQEGFYFSVYGNDALILNKYLGYKTFGVNVCKTGFPINARQNVVEKLNNLSMDYDIVDKKGNVIVSKRFKSNIYEIIDSSKYPSTGIHSDSPEPKKQEKETLQDKMEAYIEILQGLSKGVNIFTGEILQGFDEDLKSYCSDISMYFDNKLKAKENTKNKYPQLGQKWSPEEDQMLLNEYQQGKSFKEMGELHKRSVGAIKSRLLKLKVDL